MVNDPPNAEGRSEKFIRSVIWNWAGVSVSLITGFLLSPYLFRKLGPEGYGIWALCFSLIEYYWLLDLGVRSATAKFVAHYWTTGEPAKVQCSARIPEAGSPAGEITTRQAVRDGVVAKAATAWMEP